jgi:hypothetical protein
MDESLISTPFWSVHKRKERTTNSIRSSEKTGLARDRSHSESQNKSRHWYIIPPPLIHIDKLVVYCYLHGKLPSTSGGIICSGNQKQ